MSDGVCYIDEGGTLGRPLPAALSDPRSLAPPVVFVITDNQ